jgi:membrane fusion protein (multidrug efflux system)
MAQPFPNTLRALQKDNGRAVSLGLLSLSIAAVAWTLWLFGARVQVYEASERTRVEVRGAAMPVHTSVAGTVASVAVKLGQRVRRDEVLLRLDASLEERKLSSAQARLAALEPQIQVAQSELRATRGAVLAEVAVASVAARQAMARSQEARISAKLAESEASRYSTLKDAVPQIEVERARATAEMRKASSAALQLDVKRSRTERKNRERSGEARVESLRRELATLQGEQRTLLAMVAELEEQITRHTLRALGDGVVGELQALQVGSYVSAGAKLATILPAGDLILVAEFEPASALGRVRPGQAAELRLTGFPWLQYGTVAARVASVASEPREGAIRVELELLPGGPSLIPFQHGLPGSVEIAVESVSPAQLILRSLGRKLELGKSPPPPRGENGQKPPSPPP